jgi:hypothetical protein
VSEVEQRLNQKLVLRQENQDVVSLRPDESYFSRLDSSLKKNTAFVRKLVSTTVGRRVILNAVCYVFYLTVCCLRTLMSNMQNHNFACSFMRGWNIVSHTKGRT